MSKKQTNKNSLSNLKKWKKGQSGNPLGAQVHDPHVRLLKKLTKEEIKEVGSIVLKGEIDDLRKVKDDPKASILKIALASVCLKAIQKGDMYSLNVLLDRLVGKVKEEIEYSGDLKPANVNIIMPNNGRAVTKK